MSFSPAAQPCLRVAAIACLTALVLQGTPVPAGAAGARPAASASSASAPPEVTLESLLKERGALPRPELTTLQREEAIRTFDSALQGRRVKLTAKVLDALERPGGYYLQVQLPHMTRPMLLRAHREAAMAAKKGQPLVVTGVLRGLTGMALEPDLDDLRYPDLPAPGANPSATPSAKPK